MLLGPVMLLKSQNAKLTVTPLQFFSVNRFFRDVIAERPDLKRLGDVCSEIDVPVSRTRSYLISNRLPTTITSLRRIVASLGALLDAPPVYLALTTDDDQIDFDDRLIELLQPVCHWHFDHIGILKRKCCFTDEQFAVFESRWFSADFTFNHKWSEHFFRSETEQEFRDEMSSYFSRLPDEIKHLPNDQRFVLNNHLSVAFLHGTVNFPVPGVASPHLRGTFHLAARRAGTGYLAIDNLPNPNDDSIFQNLLAWFKNHNPLYSSFIPLTAQNIDLRLAPFASAAVVSVALPSNHEPMSDDALTVRLHIKEGETDPSVRHLPLELALPMCFPLLFPFPLPKIPGTTFRQKAQALLAAHPFFRRGRLQCHLILFLYHLIQDHAARFAQHQLSLQPVFAPAGTNRDIPPDVLFQDPSSPTYWSHRQAEVRALCHQFGDPDIMLTLTFVNKWPEVGEVEAENRQLFQQPMDIRFCPVETMEIWRARFYDTKQHDFQTLITAMGFGRVRHYVWRLEFQARGAPHVHALIWLSQALDADTLSRKMFAVRPAPCTPHLASLVCGSMLHTCSVTRCQRGDPTLACKYGFPKPVCRDLHISETGAVTLPRGPDDRWIVDYSPAFLLKWGGHCHVNLLRTQDSPECSPNAIHYIVKYNFKVEPSLRVEGSVPGHDSFETLFHARVTSSEEAVARIFSHDYHGSDVTCTYISLKRPDRRYAAFIHGDQVQISAVEKYYARPLELSQLRIHAFFSLYDVITLPETNNDIIRRHQTEDIALLTAPPRIDRPMHSLQDDTWEARNLPELSLIPSGLLIPSQTLPNARALQCRIRRQPAVVLTDKFNLASDLESVAYAMLLLSGCWRSDDELLASCQSYSEALQYHGLQPLDVDEISRYNRALIDYMLETSRYSAYEMAVVISRMNPTIKQYLDDKLPTADRRSTANIRSILDHLATLSRANDPILTLHTPPDNDSLRRYIHCNFTASEIEAAHQLLRVHVPQLNTEQKTIFDLITRNLASNIATNAFISGPAGTGKSFLIQALQAHITSCNLSYVTCASTGIAARLIGGLTVHSTFRIYDDGNGLTRCGLDVSRPVGRALSLCDLIIIDEVTMIPKAVLDAVDSGLRRVAAQINSPGCELPFGGKHVLLFGDLAQVPAVVRARDDYTESANQFFEATTYSSFARYGLTRVMRQDPDQQAFMKLLADLRNCDEHLSRDSVALLRSRFQPGRLEDVIGVIDDFVGRDDPFGMVITFTNIKAQLYNTLILAKRLPTDLQRPFQLRAKFFVRDPPCFTVSGHANQVPNLLPRLASESEIRIFFAAFRKRLINTIIPLELQICPGARVMLLQNLDLASGLINGSRGTVLSYIEEADTIAVRFDGSPDNTPPTLVTRTHSVELPLSRGQHMFMYQFPLKLSWAVTSHKAQGQTLSRIAVDISDSAFAHGALYVALSRVRSLDSLLLFGLPEFPEDGPRFHVNPYIRWQDRLPVDNEA